MANWQDIQTPLIPTWGGYQRTTADLNITVAPAASSLYKTLPNMRILIGTAEYRGDTKGLVVLPTAQATIFNTKIATGTVPGNLLSTTA